MVGASARPWVAYVGPFGYPEGGAAARRVHGMAQSLSLAGFDVVIASGAGRTLSDEGRLVTQEEGVSWCLLAERVAEHWPRPLRRFRYAAMGDRTVRWLASQPTLPAAVILYSGYTPYLQRLLPWCKRNGVRLLFDAVEWYEPSHPLGYLTSPYQWQVEWAMRYLIPKTDGVIAISSYLADYYRKSGMPVVVVPPTTSAIEAGKWSPDPDGILRLCYAGSPGANKDELGTVLHAVASLVAQGARVRMAVAGPSADAVLGMVGEISGSNLPWLQMAGMLSHAQVRKLVGASDFSILVRRHCRVSQAGFPTKFVESFAAGTPVISNLTSDLHLHLQNGETGLVCASPDVESIALTMTRALALGDEAIGQMRKACIDHARRTFHPAGYVDVLNSLIQQAPDN